MTDIEKIESSIRDVADFPKPGIIFKDITPMLQNPEIFKLTVDKLCAPYLNDKPDYLVCIESRGFIFGSAMAYKLGCGIVPVRKKGKLPSETVETSYSLEYGEASIEMHSDSLKSGDRVVLVDDLLATGGTVGASIELVEKLGAKITGIEFVIELCFLNGRDKLGTYPLNSIIKVD